MEQLSDTDYAALQLEKPRLPQNISVLMLYEKFSAGSANYSFGRICDVFDKARHHSTLLRRKLSDSATLLDTPYWVDDPDFDIELHVRQATLPGPGGWKELCALLGRLHSGAIDLDHAPWEAHVVQGLGEIEGLMAGGFGILLKVHHCAADGLAVIELIKKIHSLDGDRLVQQESDARQSEPHPTQGQLWSNALHNVALRSRKTVTTMRKVVPKVIAARSHTSGQDELKPGPKTRFNARVSARRAVDGLILDLERVQDIRNAVPEATLNDVILCIIGGALREYLLDKGELPESSLIAGEAVSLRAPEEDKTRGNKVGLMRIPLGTDIEEPLERLSTVCSSSLQAKEHAAATGLKDIMELVDSMGPLILSAGVKLHELSLTISSDTVPYQIGLTNIPGPRESLHLSGARLQALVGMAPIADGMGLGNCIMSCADKLSITAVGCPELVPDMAFYRQCLQRAWDELESAALAN